jgi:hypothetical protein
MTFGWLNSLLHGVAIVRTWNPTGRKLLLNWKERYTVHYIEMGVFSDKIPLYRIQYVGLLHPNGVVDTLIFLIIPTKILIYLTTKFEYGTIEKVKHKLYD